MVNQNLNQLGGGEFVGMMRSSLNPENIKANGNACTKQILKQQFWTENLLEVVYIYW
jgi:hypothetical protein